MTADGLAYLMYGPGAAQLRRMRWTPSGVITTDVPLPALAAHENIYGIFDSVLPNTPLVVDRRRVKGDEHWISRVDTSGRWVDLAKFTGLSAGGFSAVTPTYAVYVEEVHLSEKRVIRVSLTPGTPPVVVVDVPTQSHLLAEAFDPAGRFVVARTVTIGARKWSDDRSCIDVATGQPVGHYTLSGDETVAAALVLLTH